MFKEADMGIYETLRVLMTIKISETIVGFRQTLSEEIILKILKNLLITFYSDNIFP